MSKGLYICAFEEGGTLSYLSDWRDAFAEHGFDIFNGAGSRTRDYARLLGSLRKYDVIVLGYSCYYGLRGPARAQVAAFCRWSGAIVVGLLQNEFRNLADRVRYFDDFGIDVLVSQLPEVVAQELYPGRTSAKKVVSMYHGMFTGGTLNIRPHDARTVDVGSRLYDYAPYLGNYGRAVAIPALLVRLRAKGGFRIDWESDPNKRLARREWLEFLGNCRLTVAAEAGSYFLQWSETKRHQINAFVEANPAGSFLDVYRRFLKDDPAHFRGVTISPRHFEAVRMRTCQVLVEGEYNGVLQADTHYIELKSDGSNADAVVERIADREHCEGVARCAYDHVAAGHTLRHRIERLLVAI